MAHLSLGSEVDLWMQQFTFIESQCLLSQWIWLDLLQISYNFKHNQCYSLSGCQGNGRKIVCFTFCLHECVLACSQRTLIYSLFWEWSSRNLWKATESWRNPSSTASLARVGTRQISAPTLHLPLHFQAHLPCGGCWVWVQSQGIFFLFLSFSYLWDLAQFAVYHCEY